MKNAASKILGAALVVCALLVVPALVATGHLSAVTAFQLSAGLGLVGTVTVTYRFPVSGTTPPTAIQASVQNVVTAIINWAEADTIGTVTHNFGLQSGTYPGNLTQLFPEIIWYLQSGQTVMPAITFVLTDGNTITFGKQSAVGTGGSVVVIIRRPATPGM